MEERSDSIGNVLVGFIGCLLKLLCVARVKKNEQKIFATSINVFLLDFATDFSINQLFILLNKLRGGANFFKMRTCMNENYSDDS